MVDAPHLSYTIPHGIILRNKELCQIPVFLSVFQKKLLFPLLYQLLPHCKNIQLAALADLIIASLIRDFLSLLMGCRGSAVSSTFHLRFD